MQLQVWLWGELDVGCFSLGDTAVAADVTACHLRLLQAYTKASVVWCEQG